MLELLLRTIFLTFNGKIDFHNLLDTRRMDQFKGYLLNFNDELYACSTFENYVLFKMYVCTRHNIPV